VNTADRARRRPPAAAIILLRRLAPGIAAALLAAPASGAPPARPDLVVDGPTLAASWSVQLAYLLEDSCKVAAGCAGGPGFRRLLDFRVKVANVAEADLHLGDPSTNPLFTTDACDGSLRLQGFLEYELLGQGGAVAAGFLRPACVAEGLPYLGEPWVPAGPEHDCSDQGIQRGWAVEFSRRDDCAWLDVTGVPPGTYTLRVKVNPSRAITEDGYQNNAADVEITIPAAPGLPDLMFDAQMLASSWRIENRYFEPDDHAVVEECVGAPGYRDLLAFSTQTANIGRHDLALDLPGDDPRYVFSPSHGHYHLQDFADYALLDAQRNPAAPGRKQGWYLIDTDQYLFDAWVPAESNMETTGITRGWSDVYGSHLDCQWIDVTGLPAGPHILRATVNPAGVIDESDTSNNVAEAPVVLAPAAGLTHRPDGRWVPGILLTVAPAVAPEGARSTGSAAAAESRLQIGYDVWTCPAARYNLYFGLNTPVSSYTYGGAVCDVGSSGVAVVSVPDPDPGKLVWMTVVGARPIQFSSLVEEGGHGFDSAGRPRPLTATERPFCNVVRSSSNSVCAQAPPP
jgi:hypothetical protein